VRLYGPPGWKLPDAVPPRSAEPEEATE
jgi:hypothetical protein